MREAHRPPMVANQVSAAQSGGALSLLTKWPDAEMPFAQAFAEDVAFWHICDMRPCARHVRERS